MQTLATGCIEVCIDSEGASLYTVYISECAIKWTNKHTLCRLLLMDPNLILHVSVENLQE